MASIFLHRACSCTAAQAIGALLSKALTLHGVGCLQQPSAGAQCWQCAEHRGRDHADCQCRRRATAHWTPAGSPGCRCRQPLLMARSEAGRCGVLPASIRPCHSCRHSAVVHLPPSCCLRGANAALYNRCCNCCSRGWCRREERLHTDACAVPGPTSDQPARASFRRSRPLHAVLR